MKKVFIILLLVVSFNAFSQKKDSLPPLTDSTLLFSTNDLNLIDAEIQKAFSISEYGKYNQIKSFIQSLLAARTREYYLKQKK